MLKFFVVASLILLLGAVGTTYFSGCSTEAETSTVWLRWTSPDPIVGVLDRVVVISYSEPVTESNVVSARVVTIHNDPTIMGTKDSVQIQIESGVSAYYAVVSYNTVFPTTRSLVSNTVFVGGPSKVIDLSY
ncbi:hypothetical protein M0R04_05670 [Candidatus Dojkabacteria bacterium]|jgi:hypothetical protein|nr:hypothetical protein [Candidatus Dojkabacteria bacterium]